MKRINPIRGYTKRMLDGCREMGPCKIVTSTLNRGEGLSWKVHHIQCKDGMIRGSVYLRGNSKQRRQMKREFQRYLDLPLD